MKKYGLVSLIGVLVVAAIIFLFVLDSPDKEKEQANNDQDDAIQVFEDSIEVIASDDGNINANKLFIPWTINKHAGTFI